MLVGANYVYWLVDASHTFELVGASCKLMPQA